MARLPAATSSRSSSHDCADAARSSATHPPGASPPMSRLSVLVSRPRRTLAALATVLVAVGITAASGADFTATSANPDNHVRHRHAVDLQLQATAPAVLDQPPACAPATRPAPAPSTSRTPARCPASSRSTRGTRRRQRRDQPAVGQAQPRRQGLRRLLVGGTPRPATAATTVKYTGTLADMSSAVALGTFAGGEKHRYEFSVALDGTAGNAYQGDTSSVPVHLDRRLAGTDRGNRHGPPRRTRGLHARGRGGPALRRPAGRCPPRSAGSAT